MKTIRFRMSLGLIMILVLFIALIARLAYIQIFNGSAYVERAYELWTRNIPVSARRGNIYDRNGKLIVGNTLAPTISIIPKQVKDKEYASSQIASVLGLDSHALDHHFKKNVSVEILKPEAKNITLEQAKEIVNLNIDGVYIASDVIRYYPYGNVLSHVLGFVGSDNQGLTGLEYIYNDYLLGNIGASSIFTDAHGNKIGGMSDSYLSPSTGMDLYLTVDIDIQVALERVLDNTDSQYTPDESIGLVMHAQTSEVLAMSSRPTYDIVNYQDYDQSIYNRNLAIWKSFEPGSTFKFVTYSAGLEEGVFSPEDKFYDPGYAIVDGTRIRDWKAGGHGEETYWEVIQNSCNPGFVEIGMRLGKEKLFKYVKDYGFGSKTGVDLLGESTGILFNMEKVGNVELATTAFGQGISTTPIQLAAAIGACVNGGNLYMPYILKGIGIGSTIIYRDEKIFVRRVISEKTSQTMREALEKVVSLGTARNCYIEGYRAGGKTGTAQIAVDGQYLENTYILSFMGLAPMNDPQLIVYMAVNNPDSYIQYGGTVVAPLVREVLIESLNILGVKKQEGGIPLNIRYWIDKQSYKVDNYVGKKTALVSMSPYYSVRIVGDGDTIVAQNPEYGEKVEEGGIVFLYTN